MGTRVTRSKVSAPLERRGETGTTKITNPATGAEESFSVSSMMTNWSAWNRAKDRVMDELGITSPKQQLQFTRTFSEVANTLKRFPTVDDIIGYLAKKGRK